MNGKQESKKPLAARSCYGHLGGTLGSHLFERDESKSTVYKITPLGEEKLFLLGVDIYKKDKDDCTGVWDTAIPEIIIVKEKDFQEL